MSKFLILALIIAVPLLYFIFIYKGEVSLFPEPARPENPVIRIGTVPIHVEVADTHAARMQGLSGRSELAPTAGLLFIFDESDYHRIWMKDMLIPIDVIWVDERLVVVDIEHDLKPDTYPRQFEPDAPARFVIETNSGYAEAFGIKVGDQMEMPRALIPDDLR